MTTIGLSANNQAKDITMRRQIINLAGALGLAAAAFTGPALAETAEGPAQNVTFVNQQPLDEWLVRVFLGQYVQNTTGERVGDIKDLVFDRQGQISTVVIGVGGFLGMGEKSVGVTYGSLSFKTGAKGERVIIVAVTKDALMKAADFKANEKTTFDKVKDKAADLGNRTMEEASYLKDKAADKIEDMRRTEPEKK